MATPHGIDCRRSELGLDVAGELFNHLLRLALHDELAKGGYLAEHLDIRFYVERRGFGPSLLELDRQVNLLGYPQARIPPAGMEANKQ